MFNFSKLSELRVALWIPVVPSRRNTRRVLLALLVGLPGAVGAQNFAHPLGLRPPMESGPPTYLPAIGGSGGGQFKAPCPPDRNLTGFELRAGDDVDAIRPLCASVTEANSILAGPVLTVGSGLDESQLVLFAPFFRVAPGWYGGPGGKIEVLQCPSATPVVLGIDVAAEGVDTIVVNNIHLFCGRAVASQTAPASPSAIFDAPGYKPSLGWLGVGATGKSAQVRTGSQRCAPGEVAIGMHGRSGGLLDAMGLMCGKPRVYTPIIEAVPSIGRRGTTGAQVPDRPQMSICEAAQDSRARNSPAAPTLEAQCRASKR